MNRVGILAALAVSLRCRLVDRRCLNGSRRSSRGGPSEVTTGSGKFLRRTYEH